MVGLVARARAPEGEGEIERESKRVLVSEIGSGFFEFLRDRESLRLATGESNTMPNQAGRTASSDNLEALLEATQWSDTDGCDWREKRHALASESR